MLKSENPIKDSRLRVLDLDIDIASGTVWRAESVIDLPDLSYRLLFALVSKAPAMVSKDELIAEVWGDVIVGDETLMQRVKLLRQALGDNSQNPRYIASVRGRGYRLAAAVETVTEKEPAATPVTGRGRLAQIMIGVLLLAGLAYWSGVQEEAASPEIRSLAVLPFSDLSEDQNFGFFADGMQEELLARLAGLEEISVMSRTSVERFRNTTESIPAISETLNVAGIIEGSVRLSDDSIRITVQLIDGSTDRHIWADSFEERLTVANVFAIQEKVANRIAAALQAEYRQQESNALGLPTTSVDAYNAYLLGRNHTFRQTPDDLELAVQYLNTAIDLDAEFAEAYATLGWAYSFLGTFYGQREPDAVFPLAREAALRALELDDQLADAHSIYADILTWYDWNFDLAEIEYRRAMGIDPTNVLGYALFLSTQGRHEEAISILQQRLAAAPDDEYVQLNAGWNYLRAGLYEQAITAAKNSGTHPDAANLLGSCYLSTGEIDQAITVFEDDIRKRGRGQVQLGNLAIAYYRAARDAEAAAILDEIESEAEEQFVSPVMLAAIHFAAGDELKGYEMLDAAVTTRTRDVIFLNSGSSFREQRGDPRFLSILDRVGLQTEAASNM